MNFTPQQKAAINAPHDRSAIVTAAAGSGKTTLLVERMIRLLSDKELDIHGDSLAVMTFTRNAAASLRKKLIGKLSERVKAIRAAGDPDGIADTLSERLFELRSAAIGTIDSFCISILRENAQVFNLPVGFSIAGSAKLFSMKNAAMQKTMQQLYSDDFFSAEERAAVFYTFSFENDDALRDAITDIAEKVSGYADRDTWLDECAERYSSLDALLEKPIKAAVALIGAAIAECESIPAEYADTIKAYESEKKADPAIAQQMRDYAAGDLDYLTRVKSAYKTLCKTPSAENLAELYAQAMQLNPCPLPKKENRSKAHTQLTKQAKRFTLPKAFTDNIFVCDEEQRILSQQQMTIKSLTRLVRAYLDEYRSIMHTKGCLDFAECEYLLLSKLRTDEVFRGQLSARFSCVIVDEFQDSNDIQAEIFRLIANGKNDLFYVGDVKQSIYAFRGGNPKIMERLCSTPKRLSPAPAVKPTAIKGDPARYVRENPAFSVIPLNKNFRSRAAVIDSVNAVFSGVMTRRYGGVDYAAGSQLELGAACPQLSNPQDYRTEINLLRCADGTDDDSSVKTLCQARYVAGRIKEMLDTGFQVTDGDVMRPAKPSDFGILLPKNNHMTIYRDALAEFGIPSVIPKSGSFLQSEEISLLLDLLTVIDDPMRDEELIRVLMSPVFDMSAEEAAQLRLGILGLPLDDIGEDLSPIARHVRGRSLYGCVTFCSRELTCENGSDELKALCERLREKGVKRAVSPLLQDFNEKLQALRFFMSGSSIDALITKVCDDTELYNIICTYEGSRQRLANIRLLIKYAEDFEASDGGTLSDFLRFISKLDSRTLDAAGAPENASSAVRLMTFHGSKGLEMPVCFLSDLESRINISESSGQYLISHDDGISLRFVNISERYQTDTFAYKYHQNRIKKRIYGEQLRLLYVALTRAQDKLIVTSIYNSKAAGLKAKLDSPEAIVDGIVPIKWLTRSLLRDTDGAALKDIDNSEATLSQIAIGSHTLIQLITEDEALIPEDVCEDEEERESSHEEEITADPALVEQITAQLKQVYPHAQETTLQAKYTVTELAHSADPNAMMVYLNMPSFARGNSPTGKEVGDAYHHFMEHCPLERFTQGASQDMIAQTIDELCDSGLLTAAEGDILHSARRGCIKNLCAFFESAIGKRALANVSAVFRETPFYAELPAQKLGLTGERLVCIQGRTDMYFVENGGITLIDYKSDTQENLEKELDSYCRQLESYMEILPQVTGLPVRELYIYSFSLGKEIDVLSYLCSHEKKGQT